MHGGGRVSRICSITTNCNKSYMIKYFVITINIYEQNSSATWDPAYIPRRKDKDGFLHKDSVRGIYDGSVFVKLEEKRRSLRSEV